MSSELIFPTVSKTFVERSNGSSAALARKSIFGDFWPTTQTSCWLALWS